MDKQLFALFTATDHAVGFIGASFRWEKNGLPILKK